MRRATTPKIMIKGEANRFLSTLSLRRATIFNTLQIIVDGYFYPRSPCGERPLCNVVVIDQCHFYPRSPCGERHGPLLRCGRYWHISIHALLAESDGKLFAGVFGEVRFLSTLSLRRATINSSSTRQAWPISIHALLAESDQITRRGFACPI